jgi:hypothetical protein
MSRADVAEPLSDLPHDFVDLERLQKSRFLLQLCTPCNQDLVRSLFIVIAFINDLLDGHFPFLKTHRLFLFDFGVGGDDDLLRVHKHVRSAPQPSAEPFLSLHNATELLKCDAQHYSNRIGVG